MTARLALCALLLSLTGCAASPSSPPTELDALNRIADTLWWIALWLFVLAFFTDHTGDKR